MFLRDLVQGFGITPGYKAVVYDSTVVLVFVFLHFVEQFVGQSLLLLVVGYLLPY